MSSRQPGGTAAHRPRPHARGVDSPRSSPSQRHDSGAHANAVAAIGGVEVAPTAARSSRHTAASFAAGYASIQAGSATHSQNAQADLSRPAIPLPRPLPPRADAPGTTPETPRNLNVKRRGVHAVTRRRAAGRTQGIRCSIDWAVDCPSGLCPCVAGTAVGHVCGAHPAFPPLT